MTTKRTPTPTVRPLVLPPAPPVRSARAAAVVRWFGLDRALAARAQAANDASRASGASDAIAPPAPALDLSPGTITLVTGPSGAGKSSLLREVRDAPATTWIDLATLALPDVPVVDCFDEPSDDDDADVRSHPDARAPANRDARNGPDAPKGPDALNGADAPNGSNALNALNALNGPDAPDAPVRRALLRLARVGLAEAWTYLRTPAELSDGQRWRLRLAIALDRAERAMRRNGPESRVILLADEFAALLDRVTACVVARSLRRVIAPGSRLAALVATSHHDLVRALAPDVIVHCDFGRLLIVPVRRIAPAARGFAGQPVPATTGPAPRRPGRTTPHPGGPVRKIVITSLAAATLVSLPAPSTARAAADDDARPRASVIAPAPRGNDRLLLEPRSPFEPPRSLFEFDPRPTRRPVMPLYPTVERELDRGAGRIESDAEHDASRLQREQDERRGLIPEQRPAERFGDAFDRSWRLQQQARRERLARDEQLHLETESQRLAAERERFYRSAGIDTTGAAADAAELARLERDYQRDVKQLKRDRAAELKRLARQDLTPNGRRAGRTEIDLRYQRAQTARRERYAVDRARVMGSE